MGWFTEIEKEKVKELIRNNKWKFSGYNAYEFTYESENKSLCIIFGANNELDFSRLYKCNLSAEMNGEDLFNEVSSMLIGIEIDGRLHYIKDYYL